MSAEQIKKARYGPSGFLEHPMPFKTSKNIVNKDKDSVLRPITDIGMAPRVKGSMASE